MLTVELLIDERRNYLPEKKKQNVIKKIIDPHSRLYRLCDSRTHTYTNARTYAYIIQFSGSSKSVRDGKPTAFNSLLCFGLVVQY